MCQGIPNFFYYTITYFSNCSDTVNSDYCSEGQCEHFDKVRYFECMEPWCHKLDKSMHDADWPSGVKLLCLPRIQENEKMRQLDEAEWTDVRKYLVKLGKINAQNND